MVVAVAVAATVAVGGPDKLAAALGGKGKGEKPPPTLEFAASEVVAPMLASMPGVVEFSGPLVAPGTAIVRAKAGGTLLALSVAEGPACAPARRSAASTWPTSTAASRSAWR